MQHTDTRPATANPPMDPGTGAGPQATIHAIADVLPPPDVGPAATVSLLITRDRIRVMGSLRMGGRQLVLRTFDRMRGGAWLARDPEFIAAEERIGVELAEYLDGLDFPSRIADMLPRPPAAGSTAAATAAEEVRRG